jgi:hypothetical protein
MLENSLPTQINDSQGRERTSTGGGAPSNDEDQLIAELQAMLDEVHG